MVTRIRTRISAWLLALLTACGPAKQLTPTTTTTVRIVEHQSIKLVPVSFPLPEIRAEVQRKDSLIRLDNQYAWAEARLYRDGRMGLILETKPQELAATVPVETTEIVRDSLVFKEAPVPVEVPAELTPFQRVKLALFLPLLALAALAYRKQLWALLKGLVKTLRP